MSTSTPMNLEVPSVEVDASDCDIDMTSKTSTNIESRQVESIDSHNADSSSLTSSIDDDDPNPNAVLNSAVESSSQAGFVQTSAKSSLNEMLSSIDFDLKSNSKSTSTSTSIRVAASDVTTTLPPPPSSTDSSSTDNNVPDRSKAPPIALLRRQASCRSISTSTTTSTTKSKAKSTVNKSKLIVTNKSKSTLTNNSGNSGRLSQSAIQPLSPLSSLKKQVEMRRHHLTSLQRTMPSRYSSDAKHKSSTSISSSEELSRVKELTVKWRLAAQLACQDWLDRLNERGANMDMSQLMARSGIDAKLLRWNEKRNDFVKN